MAETMERLGLPESVTAGLGEFTEKIRAAAGENLAALVLYGGLARGRYRPGKSDVNVLVLLRSASAKNLAAIAPTVSAAWRSQGVEVLVLALSELKAAAAEFPVKFLDIRRVHVLLHGDDALAGLEVDDRLVRHRLSQELRNLSLRLRRRYLLDFDDPPALRRALSRAVTPLCVQLGILLDLDAKRPEREECSSVFDAAAAEYLLDRQALRALEQIGSAQGAPDPKACLASTLEAIDRVLERVAPEEASL